VKTGKVVKKESPTASPEASKPMPVPKTPPPSVKAKMANELMPYLQFVEKHPVGSKVKAVVQSYAANGITALIGDISGYVPLRNMANPQPRSARDIFTLGDSVTLTVVGYTPARRSVDLAIPGVVDAATKPSGKPSVAKKVAPEKKAAADKAAKAAAEKKAEEERAEAEAAKKAAVRKQVSKGKGDLIQTNSKNKKWLRQYRITNAERKARVQAKIQKAISKK
jgi:hypothetical protein